MFPRPQHFVKRVMWLMLLLLLLGTDVSGQQQHEEEQKQPRSEAVVQQQPVEESEPQEKLQQSEQQPQLQEKRQQPQLQEGEERSQQQQQQQKQSPSSPPAPPRQEQVEQQLTGEEEEQRGDNERLPQSPSHGQERQQLNMDKLTQKQQKKQPRKDEVVVQQQRQLQEEEEQAGSEPAVEPSLADLPSRQERQQPQKGDEERHHQPKTQPQEDGEQQQQPSSNEPLSTDLPTEKAQQPLQEEQPQAQEEQPQPQEDEQQHQKQQHQQQQQQEQIQEVEQEEEEPQHHQEPHPQEELPQQLPQEHEEQREEKEAPLPSDLPSLRWSETARLSKCCPPDSVLVRRPGGGPPACETVPSDQRWRPLLLNGRSGQRTPPDARSALVSGNVSCSGEHFWLDSTDGDRFELLTTGHLYLRRSDALMAPLSFCADRLLTYPEEGSSAGKARAGLAARVCALSLQERRSVLDETTLMPVCARHTCLRKCCPRGLKMRWEDQLCVPQTGARPWDPEFRLDDGPAPDYHTVAGNPPCTASDGTLGKVFALQPAYYDDEKFFLREDGRLWVPHQEIALELEDFCVDQVEYEHPQQPGVLVDYHAAIVCFGEGGAAVRVSAATYVYRALLLVSALFLLATLVVYCSVPELRNLHGRCLLSHVAALLTAYGSNLAGQLAPIYSNMVACQVTALVMYFSFLAACFWLNAMSFDIWLTFSRIRSAAPNRSQTGRFIKYSLYCWCCPLVLTAVVITMQFVPDDVAPPENFIRPRLGERSCWFPGSWEMLTYFHGPILLLMTANFVFFVLTAKNLLQTEKDTRMAGRQKKGTERFKIYVNLFIVMGITWIAEALSIHMGPKEIWFVTDVFNALQGFFIFLLFTLRQNTRNTIRKHFTASSLGRCCCKVTSLVPGLSSRKTTSTSAQGSGSAKSAAPAQQTGVRPSSGHAGGDRLSDTPV